MPADSDTPLQLFAQIVEPLTAYFTVETAREVSRWRASDEIQARLDELASKCNEGLLSTGEEQEYRDWVEAIDLITLMQLRARSFLKKNTAA